MAFKRKMTHVVEHLVADLEVFGGEEIFQGLLLFSVLLMN